MSRILLKFKPNLMPVPINFQTMQNVYIYGKCFDGDKELHDSTNLHCTSQLYGGKLKDNSIEFKNGGLISFSTINESIMRKLIMGAFKHKDLFCGMEFDCVDAVFEKFYNGCNHFSTLSPFVFKENDRDSYKYVVFNDPRFLSKISEKTKKNKLIILDYPEFSEYATNRTKNKLLKIDPELDLTKFKIEIHPHKNHKIKKTIIKKGNSDVVVFSNQCQLSIYGNSKVSELIYNVGLGQSTGSGFGTIYKTENHHLYKI